METIRYRHRDFPHNSGRFSIMQPYLTRPYLLLTTLFGMMILFIVAQHDLLLWPGLIGAFIVAFLGNFLGLLFAKGHYLEIGFIGEEFYMRSAYDLAYGRERRLYPLRYAHPTRSGGDIVLNYIDQTVHLRAAEWEHWHEIWHCLIEPPQPAPGMYPFSSTL